MTIENWSKQCYVHFPCCHGKSDYPEGVSVLVDWRIHPAQALTCPRCGQIFVAFQSVRGAGIVMKKVEMNA
jgi:hypothetical protein